MSPAQFQSYIHYLKTHHFTKTQRAAFNKRKAATAKRGASKHTAAGVRHSGRKAGAAGVLRADSPWVTGMNDLLGTCVAVAVANSLVAAGFPVTDEDAVLLHAAAGGTEWGSDPAEVLALAAGGFLGPEPSGSGLVVLHVPGGLHCVYRHEDFVVSHGREIPWESVSHLAVSP